MHCHPRGGFVLEIFKKALDIYIIWCYDVNGGDEVSEKTISFKVDEEFFTELKIQIAKEGKTLKDYLIELIRKDLEAKREQK